MAKNFQIRVMYLFVKLSSLFLLAIPGFIFFLILHLILLSKKILVLFSSKQAKLNPFHNGEMIEMDRLSSAERLDFMRHRSPLYIYQLSFGCLWEFSNFVGNNQRVPLMEDHVIVDLITSCPHSYGLIKGDKESDVAWRLPFDLDHYKLFKIFYWDIQEIVIHKNNQVSFIDRIGRVHTPSSPSWDLAKAHTQVQLSFFAPGMAHNHVHFVFPTLMAYYVRSTLPETSVLRQLIEPHTRFTQYINFQALHVGQSSSNTRSLVDRWFKPWLSFPVTNKDFIDGIKHKCENFYYKDLCLQQNMDEDLPYSKFLKSYFQVCHRFVKKIQSLIEDDCDILLSSIEKSLPAVTRYESVDLIATLLWNCAVVHFCDHQSYMEVFAKKYACMAMRIPLVKDGEQNCQNQFKNYDEDGYCRYFAPQDIYRTRCFMRTFVRFNPGSDLNMKLIKTQYAFTNPSAIKASEEFLRDLTDLDQALRDRKEDIVGLDQIIRSICF